jgi:hypothetical protein
MSKSCRPRDAAGLPSRVRTSGRRRLTARAHARGCDPEDEGGPRARAGPEPAFGFASRRWARAPGRSLAADTTSPRRRRRSGQPGHLRATSRGANGSNRGEHSQGAPTRRRAAGQVGHLKRPQASRKRPSGAASPSLACGRTGDGGRGPPRPGRVAGRPSRRRRRRPGGPQRRSRPGESAAVRPRAARRSLALPAVVLPDEDAPVAGRRVHRSPLCL